ncbi:hypothetical protein MNO14_08185 [Luteimonas sp. S4-F44]|uniref:hypothetical protein n=1 Tax=Luteimonas sp. S4-F44 TaxID=2925842 RepID=UPI001F533BEE|nr:hypothetical protein [Luteimonas sp. S4-F44]UNK44012.1 hypothetical protein MNO14_08185 [Luteimonas sp. S4-F44]
MARKQTNNAYQAWTYILAGLLALTNAAWFLSSRIKANDHAAALAAATAPAPTRERVVYEYRERPQPQSANTRSSFQRTLAPNEQCRSGFVFTRDGNAWGASGERCDPTLL